MAIAIEDPQKKQSCGSNSIRIYRVGLQPQTLSSARLSTDDAVCFSPDLRRESYENVRVAIVDSLFSIQQDQSYIPNPPCNIFLHSSQDVRTGQATLLHHHHLKNRPTKKEMSNGHPTKSSSSNLLSPKSNHQTKLTTTTPNQPTTSSPASQPASSPPRSSNPPTCSKRGCSNRDPPRYSAPSARSPTVPTRYNSSGAARCPPSSARGWARRFTSPR